MPYAEAALQRCSHEKAPRKNAPNPQKNTHSNVQPEGTKSDQPQTKPKPCKNKHFTSR